MKTGKYLFALCISTCLSTWAPLSVAEASPAAADAQEKCTLTDCSHGGVLSYNETIAQVIKLYKNKEFNLLESGFKNLEQATVKIDTGVTGDEVIFYAFKAIYPGPGNDPSEEQRLAAWKEVAKGSIFLEYAQIAYVRSLAWQARGGGFANTVSSESWQRFFQGLAQTEEMLTKASEQLKASPLWGHISLNLAFDNEHSTISSTDMFAYSVRKWPDYYGFQESVMPRLLPMWGGSLAEVDKFATYWSGQRTATEGTSLYARLYLSLVSKGVTPQQTQYDWSRMSASFKDLIARYPSPTFPELYANYACLQHDEQAAKFALSKIRDQPFKFEYWVDNSGKNFCLTLIGQGLSASVNQENLIPL